MISYRILGIIQNQRSIWSLAKRAVDVNVEYVKGSAPGEESSRAPGCAGADQLESSFAEDSGNLVFLHSVN